jgi:hypothetical protein
LNEKLHEWDSNMNQDIFLHEGQRQAQLTITPNVGSVQETGDRAQHMPQLQREAETLTVHTLGRDRVERLEEFLVPLEGARGASTLRARLPRLYLGGLAEVQVYVTGRVGVEVVFGPSTDNIGV